MIEQTPYPLENKKTMCLCVKKEFRRQLPKYDHTKHLEELMYEMIGAAIEVNKTIGRGLQE